MKTRVAFVTSQFPCYDEAFILREIHALSKKMDVLIFSLKKSKDKTVHDEAHELLEKTFYVPFLLSGRILRAQAEVFLQTPARYLGALLKLVWGNLRSPEFLLKNLAFFPKAVYLARWIRKERVSHLHAYWATYPASVALVASEIAGIPFSFTGHAHDIYVDTTHLAHKIERATFVSTCTTLNKKHLLEVAPGVRPEKIMIHYHGLDPERFAVNGKKRNPVFQILSVGTLQCYKGFNFLLQALALLKERGLNFHGTIVGGGPLREDLERHLQMLGLQAEVTLTGPLKQDEVISHYRHCDLFVLMAQREWHWGIPNVIIESLAARTAVITTRFGSVEELVEDGVSGLLVPPKDPETLARAIECLYLDDPLRRRLADAGYRRVLEEFDLNKNILCLQERFQSQDETSAALVA